VTYLRIVDGLWRRLQNGEAAELTEKKNERNLEKGFNGRCR